MKEKGKRRRDELIEEDPEAQARKGRTTITLDVCPQNAQHQFVVIGLSFVVFASKLLVLTKHLKHGFVGLVGYICH